MRKRRASNYNDGIVELYQRLTDKNVKSMEDLEYLTKLAFDEKTVRQEDKEFAMQHDKQITLKIVTQDDGNMDTSRCAVIGNVIYSIIKIDRDRKKNELYFYLQEVRKIDCRY